MVNGTKKPELVVDQSGWALGLKAVFRGLFGTDTEVRIEHGGVEAEIDRAKEEVRRMSDEAESLLRTLHGNSKAKEDPVKEEMDHLLQQIR